MMGTEQQYLDTKQLAQRWGLAPHTVAKHRMRKYGPAYLRLAGKVLYPLQEVERFEAANLRRAS